MIIYKSGYNEHIAYKIKKREKSHIERAVKDSESKGVY
jgi:hypothetical protein